MLGLKGVHYSEVPLYNVCERDNSTNTSIKKREIYNSPPKKFNCKFMDRDSQENIAGVSSRLHVKVI